MQRQNMFGSHDKGNRRSGCYFVRCIPLMISMLLACVVRHCEMCAWPGFQHISSKPNSAMAELHEYSTLAP